MATKYRLELLSLHCDHLQDTLSRDEPKILVDGVTLYGPGDIGKGGTVTLTGRSAFFFGTTQVQLIEVDSGPDDDMGTVTIKGATDVGQGPLKREFHRTYADYVLSYEVVAA